jgi:hypothetical protein
MKKQDCSIQPRLSLLALEKAHDVSKLVAFWLLGHVMAKGRPFLRWYPY